MRDEREFNEIDEQELEQVSGGSGSSDKATYRCPICGKKTKSDRPPLCLSCTTKSLSGRSVSMELVSE